MARKAKKAGLTRVCEHFWDRAATQNKAILRRKNFEVVFL